MLVNMSDQDKAEFLVASVVASAGLDGMRQFLNMFAADNNIKTNYSNVADNIYENLDGMENTSKQIKAFKDYKNIVLSIDELNNLRKAIVANTELFTSAIKDYEIPKEVFIAFQTFIAKAPKFYNDWATNLTWTKFGD